MSKSGIALDYKVYYERCERVRIYTAYLADPKKPHRTEEADIFAALQQLIAGNPLCERKDRSMYVMQSIMQRFVGMSRGEDFPKESYDDKIVEINLWNDTQRAK